MRKIAWLLLISPLCMAIGCSNNGGTNPNSTAAAGASSPAAAPPETTDADNTARNAGDSTLAVTPTSQAENATDLQISAAIRKSVTDDKALSVNAHNIKIITANAVVTLRGPVKSEEEKKAIESIARQVAGVTQVNNLLEVEKNP